MREPPAPLRQVKPKEGAPPAKPKAEQIELPLFRIEEIMVASRGGSISSDLIESCCERGIRIAFLNSTGQPVAMLFSPMLTATVQTRREQMAAYGDKRGVEIARAIVRGKVANQRNPLKDPRPSRPERTRRRETSASGFPLRAGRRRGPGDLDDLMIAKTA